MKNHPLYVTLKGQRSRHWRSDIKRKEQFFPVVTTVNNMLHRLRLDVKYIRPAAPMVYWHKPRERFPDIPWIYFCNGGFQYESRSNL